MARQNMMYVISTFIILIILLLAAIIMFIRRTINSNKIMSSAVSAPNSTSLTYPNTGAFNPYGYYDPNTEINFYMAFLLGNPGYVPYISLSKNTFVDFVRFGSAAPTNNYVAFTPNRITVSQQANGTAASPLAYGYYYVMDKDGVAIYSTDTSTTVRPAVSIPIYTMDIYWSMDTLNNAIALTTMDRNQIVLGVSLPGLHATFDGKSAAYWELNSLLSLDPSSCRTISIQSNLTPIIDFTIDDYNNIYIIGSDSHVYWLNVSPFETVNRDIIDIQTIELDSSISGFTSISASKQTITSCLYGFNNTTRIMYYISTQTGNKWTQLTALTGLNVLTIADFELTTPIHTLLPVTSVLNAPIPTTTIQTNDLATLGAIRSGQSFMGWMEQPLTAIAQSTGRFYIANYKSNTSWVAAFPSSKTLITTATQVTGNFMVCSGASLASLRTLVVVDNSNTHIAYYTSMAANITTQYLLQSSIVSGDLVSPSGPVSPSGANYFAITTDGFSIKVKTNVSNSETSSCSYYYYLSDLADYESITQIVLDSYCNIYVLLSSGICGVLNSTITPSRSQYGTLTMITNYTNIQSITVDKTNNILYGLIANTGTVISAAVNNGVLQWGTSNIININPSLPGITSIYSYPLANAYTATIPSINLLPSWSVPSVTKSTAVPTTANLHFYYYYVAPNGKNYISDIYEYVNGASIQKASFVNPPGVIGYTQLKYININNITHWYTLQRQSNGNHYIAEITNIDETGTNVTATVVNTYNNSSSIDDFDFTISPYDPDVLYWTFSNSGNLHFNAYTLDGTFLKNPRPYVCPSGCSGFSAVACDTEMNVFYIQDDSLMYITTPQLRNSTKVMNESLVNSSVEIYNTPCLTVDKENGILYLLNGGSLYYLNAGTNMIPTLVNSVLPGFKDYDSPYSYMTHISSMY